MYKCKHFKLCELLPPDIYKNEEEGWELLDERLLKTIDAVREIIGKPLICNNWKAGGKRTLSGYRPKDCPIGAKRSQHKLGRAADLICNTISASDMREMIDNKKVLLPFNVRIERNVAWLHIDVKDMGQKIYYFYG